MLLLMLKTATVWHIYSAVTGVWPFSFSVAVRHSVRTLPCTIGWWLQCQMFIVWRLGGGGGSRSRPQKIGLFQYLPPHVRVTIFSRVRSVSGLVDVMSGSALSGTTLLILAFKLSYFAFLQQKLLLNSPSPRQVTQGLNTACKSAGCNPV